MPLSHLLALVGAAVLPSLALSYAAGFVVRRYAARWGLVDHPGPRKVHAAPTPRAGGLAIWLAVVTPFGLGLALLACLAPAGGENPVGGAAAGWAALIPEFARPHLPGLWLRAGSLLTLLAGGTALMLLGLADDRFNLHWKTRLGAQFAVAAVCVASQGWKLTVFVDLPWLTGALSVVWIVALVNSFNMLDNMDGLSAGVAVIAASLLAAVLLLMPVTELAGPHPQLFVGGFLLVLVGALLGFLPHNRPPAKLFMGDAGSYFIGFCLATAALLSTYTSYHSSKRHAILVPLCVLAVPLYDMASVIVIRLAEGRSPFHADKSHFSHRLVELGLSKTQAVLTVHLTTATCGLGALLLHRVDALGAGVVTLMVACVLALIAILETTARRKLRQSEQREATPPAAIADHPPPTTVRKPS